MLRVRDLLPTACQKLKSNGDKRFIAFNNWEHVFRVWSDKNVYIKVFGVGINQDGKICVAAVVDTTSEYAPFEHGFPKEWTDAETLQPTAYAYIYDFVNNFIESAITEEEADKIAKSYWEKLVQPHI